jgi:serine protease inhibitor
LNASFQTLMMDFSWNIFKQTIKDKGNVLISPASIYLAISMAANGADGDTLIAIQKALSSENITSQQLNASCRDWISLLRVKTDKTTVSVANSIWFRQSYPVSQAFLKTNADYFDAAAQALDFNSPEAAKTINNWVKSQTQGKIDSIVDKVDASTIMYLINAVYFKSDWTTPFDAHSTAKGDFIATSGTISANFMHRTGGVKFIDSKGVKGVLLPYDNGRYSFFAVLPPEGQDVRAYVNGLTGADIAVLIQSMKSGEVRLSLPKFEIQYQTSLKNNLAALGMGVAFTDSANFSRINAQGVSNLMIYDVLHKTYCRVDEKGTEAAAVTSVQMGLTAMPLNEVVIRFDRPFMFGIIDSASGTPLFLGLLDSPTQ